MRWPWARKRDDVYAINKREAYDAQAALQASRERLEEARSRNPEVKEVAASLRNLREENHFAESLAQSMRRVPRKHP